MKNLKKLDNIQIDDLINHAIYNHKINRHTTIKGAYFDKVSNQAFVNCGYKESTNLKSIPFNFYPKISNGPSGSSGLTDYPNAPTGVCGRQEDPNTQKIGNVHFDKKILEFLNVDNLDEFTKNIKTLKIIGRHKLTNDIVFKVFNGDNSINIVYYDGFYLFSLYEEDDVKKLYDNDQYSSLLEKRNEMKEKQDIIKNEIATIEKGQTQIGIDDDIFIKFKNKIIKYYDDIKIHNDIESERHNINVFLDMDIIKNG